MGGRSDALCSTARWWHGGTVCSPRCPAARGAHPRSVTTRRRGRRILGAGGTGASNWPPGAPALLLHPLVEPLRGRHGVATDDDVLHLSDHQLARGAARAQLQRALHVSRIQELRHVDGSGGAGLARRRHVTTPLALPRTRWLEMAIHAAENTEPGDALQKHVAYAPTLLLLHGSPHR